jgi:hypothetical protein
MDSKVKVKASDIGWETDGEEVDLPSEVELEIYDLPFENDKEWLDYIHDEVVDALSNQYGWLVKHVHWEEV